MSETDDAWRARLSEDEYRITRCGGTERAFTGQYWATKTPGIYRCRCCHAPLFASTTKYDSGSGWPSFTSPIGADAVAESHDDSHGMHRTEVTCAHCQAHLGHVFPDGPAPTRLRYCINSASLALEPTKDPDGP